MDTVFKDLSYGGRSLLRNPGFSCVAVITLALGIGANTAIFSVINAVLLRPLPYPNSDRLLFISERDQQMRRLFIAWPNFLDWQAQNGVFENISVYNRDSYNLTGTGDPQQVLAGQVSASFFQSLSVNPHIGRVFSREEDQPGAAPVAVLSYGLWQRIYGGDASILNRSITLNNRSYSVLGVMPADFQFPGRVELWVSAGQLSNDWLHRNNHPGLYALARLKDGVTIEQARADLNRIAAALETQYPDTNRGHGVGVTTLMENTLGDINRSLWILFAAAGLVLAIACANVASLMLLRFAARQKELAIRAAIGAGRLRLARQLLAESLMISLVGGAVGLLLAYWLLAGLVDISTTSLPRASEINLDLTVLIFTAGCSLLTSLLFGIVPAWCAGRVAPDHALKDFARGSVSLKQRTGAVLVVSEIALALVLLIGAGLLLRSFYRLGQVNPGFDYENVLSFSLSLPNAKYPTIDQRVAFYTNLIEKLSAQPGVQSAGLSSGLPFGRSGWRMGFAVEGQPVPPANEAPELEAYAVSPDYFRTMGIPLREGRFLTEQDNRRHLAGRDLTQLDEGAKQVMGLNAIVVDEEFARRHWPNQSAVGKRIRLAPVDEGSPYLTVAGVVGRVKMDRLNVQSNRVQCYFSVLQFPLPSIAVVLKSSLDAAQLTSLARHTVQSVDPNQPIYSVRTLETIRSESLAPESLNLMLLSLFAILALALAAIGIYGVISYAAAQRTHEIGIRMALGALPRDILSLIARQGLKLAVIGVAIGLLAAFALARVMQQLLFSVSATDAITFVCVPVVLLVVAAVACYLPARRATRVDPLVALRGE
jgi:putative ABC transport system permease protein